MKLPKLYNLIAGLLMLVTLPACEDEVKNLREQDLSPRLVVNSYISPQNTYLQVQLQTTQPGVGQSKPSEQLRVTNASVTMSDGTTTVTLPYNPDKDIYEVSAASLPVVAGKKYFLKVATPGGFKAEASCTVPSVDGIILSELNHKLTTAGIDNEMEHQFRYKWSDATDAVNYYHSLAYLVIREPNPNGNIVSRTQTFHINEDELKTLFTDQGASGMQLQSPRFFTNTNDSINIHGMTEYDVHALLLVSDIHYHKYHQSMLNQSHDNPFSEPIFVYSNIQGALGVFGGYNTLDDFITIR